MNTKLDLSVPAASPQPARTPRLLGFLLLVVLALQVALLVGGQRLRPPQPTGSSDLPAEPSRALALKLEKQGLNEAAATAMMSAYPALIKRPLFDLGEKRVIGFRDQEKEIIKKEYK